MAKLRLSGFSLVEVLISILVLAVGVIGAVGMQLTALRTSQQSALHTVALQLAADMADRMRANVVQMRLGDAHNPYLRVDYRATDDGKTAAEAACHESLCTDAQLAQADIRSWLIQVGDKLPGGRARLCRDAMPWDERLHAYQWNCTAGTGAPVVIKLGWRDRKGAADFSPTVVLAVPDAAQ